MTLAALSLRRDMIYLLAQRDDTVMTIRAVTYHVQMVKTASAKVDKVTDIVTIRTIPGGWHVIRALSGTYLTVMT